MFQSVVWISLQTFYLLSNKRVYIMIHMLWLFKYLIKIQSESKEYNKLVK